MNRPSRPRALHPRNWAWPAHLPPAAEVPLLDPRDRSEQAVEDARFVASFVRAEAGRARSDWGDADD